MKRRVWGPHMESCRIWSECRASCEATVTIFRRHPTTFQSRMPILSRQAYRVIALLFLVLWVVSLCSLQIQTVVAEGVNTILGTSQLSSSNSFSDYNVTFISGECGFIVFNRTIYYTDYYGGGNKSGLYPQGTYGASWNFSTDRSLTHCSDLTLNFFSVRFLRWNATGNLTVSNPGTNLTNVSITGPGTLRAIEKDVPLSVYPLNTLFVGMICVVSLYVRYHLRRESRLRRND
jgi:hypothetical protein